MNLIVKYCPFCEKGVTLTEDGYCKECGNHADKMDKYGIVNDEAEVKKAYPDAICYSHGDRIWDIPQRGITITNEVKDELEADKEKMWNDGDMQLSFNAGIEYMKDTDMSVGAPDFKKWINHYKNLKK